MAHFAKVVDDIVTRIIVAEPEFFETFVDDSPGKWIQCSYNTRGGVHYNPETMEPDGGVALRYNYPAEGWIYNKEADAFYAPQPFPSWTLNTDSYVWEPPTPHPIVPAGEFIDYTWDEENLEWVCINE